MAKAKLWKTCTWFIIPLAFAVLSLSSSDGKKILVLSWPNGRSHFNALEKIGKELELRGHEVTFLISSMENYIDKVNVHKEVYRVPGVPVDYMSSLVTKATQEYERLPLATAFELFTVLRNSCEAIFADKGLLERVKDADLLLADGTFVCGAILAEYFSIPRVDVAMWSFNDPMFSYLYNIPNPVSYVPQMSSGFSSKMTFLQRTLNTIWSLIIIPITETLIRFSAPSLDANKIGHGKSLQEIIGQAQLVLVPTDFALEWARPVLPTTKVIGAVLSKQTAEKLPAELEDFMQSSKSYGVVAVSFGSNVGSLDSKTNEILASAFSRLKQKVIWRVKGPAPKNLGANTKIMKWLPQFDLLAHSKMKAFVSHCGMNGMYESASHGVPVLAMPLYGDQLNNAQQLVHAGMAIKIQLRSNLGFTKNKFNADAIVEAIEQLIYDPRYKENAVRVSRLLKDHPKRPEHKGADWVEYVLRHNGTAHLRPKVFELNWFQFYLVDVILFVAACALFMAIIFLQVCKQCLRVCCRKKVKEKTN